MTAPTRLSHVQALDEALETGALPPVEVLISVPEAARSLLWARLYEAFVAMPGPEAGWRGEALVAPI